MKFWMKSHFHCFQIWLLNLRVTANLRFTATERIISTLLLNLIFTLISSAATPAATEQVPKAPTQPPANSNELMLNNQSLNISFPNFKSFNRAYQTARLRQRKTDGDSLQSVIEKYRLALASLLQNRPSMALAILPSTISFEKVGLPTDRLLLTQARAHYQALDNDAAIEAYSQIPQDSDLWLIALEERAHAQGRARHFEKAVADLTTLFSPVFNNVVGPEAYVTAGLTYLRLCQYSKVFEYIRKFKEQMKQRVAYLNAIVDGNATEVIVKATGLLKTNPYKGLAYVPLAPQLPRSFHLDFTVRDLIRKSKVEKSEFSTGLVARISQLAQQDLEEIKSNLTKMQLVEAEVMQGIPLAESLKSQRRDKLGKFKAGRDQLYFPFNGEVWLDELDSYQVQSKICPKEGGGA